MSDFLASAPESARDDIATSPSGPLWAGLVTQVMSLLLAVAGAVVFSAVPRHVIGWLLASPLTFTLVVVQRRMTEELRASDRILVIRSEVERASIALLVSAVALSGVHSWLLATELAS